MELEEIIRFTKKGRTFTAKLQENILENGIIEYAIDVSESWGSYKIQVQDGQYKEISPAAAGMDFRADILLHVVRKHRKDGNTRADLETINGAMIYTELAGRKRKK